MFRYKKKICVIIIYTLFFIPVVLYAQIISSKELLGRQEFFDGKEITYEGEIIGEMMCRKGGCWLNVKDRDLAIGVWVPSEIKFIPKYTGSYKYRGDEIRVKGRFNRSCKEHLGETDIHAEEITLIKEGKVIPQRLIRYKLNLVMIIWGILCLILILMRLKKI